MKKILAIILAAVLVLSFAACKKNDINNDTTAGDAQTSGQAADVSASDETASSEEASSEVETEVVTDKAGHTVIETKASQSSDTKTTTNGNYTTITFNVKDQTQGAKADNRSGSVGYTVNNLKGIVAFSYTAKG